MAQDQPAAAWLPEATKLLLERPPGAGALPSLLLLPAGGEPLALISGASAVDGGGVSDEPPAVPSLPQGSVVGAVVVGVLLIVTFSALFITCMRSMARRRTPLGRIAQLSIGETKLLVPATLCLFTASALQLLIPYYGGQFIKLLTSGDLSSGAVDRLMIKLLSAAAILSVFTGIRGYLYQLAGERVINTLRKRIFASLLRQEMGYFDSETSGQLVSRLTNDAGTLQSAATVDISMALRSFASLVMSLVILFATSWKLTLMMLGVVPVSSLLAAAMGRLSRKIGKAYQEKLAEVGMVAGETLGNMRTVRAFCHGERLMMKRFGDASDSTYFCGRKQAIVSGSWSSGVGLLFYVAFSVVMWYGAQQVRQGELEVGALVSFILYTLSLSASIAMLGSILPRFGTVLGATAKVFEILDREPSMADGTRDPPASEGSLVEFDAVSFVYPTRPDIKVLSSVSFVAKPNQVVALVGPSGSGKSSCVSLLQRLYDVADGCVRIDGHDVRELTSAYLRRHVAVVSQEPVLFATSVRENIRFGAADDVSEEAMIEAAKLANCHDFVSGFPEGYATAVGERGLQLSGGQKQRVAIARAMLASPSILLLDEATSALDAESEGIVQDALNELMRQRCGRTHIVVAHRLSTVRQADCIVVLKDGVVQEMGSHADLLASNSGVYKDLVQRQLDDPALAA